MPQYQPTTYYDWKNREHGAFLESGVLTDTVSYDYYAGDTITTTNSVFKHMNYVSYDNTHVRLLNDTDLNLYDTSDIKVYDSGTITQYTSASPVSRVFTVDSTGKVGIGLSHTQPLSSIPERPAFDLHVRGTVGVEDFIYHNDDTDTYILFGDDETTHYVNINGTPDLSATTDYDEINIRVGGVDMLQMQTRDLSAITTDQDGLTALDVTPQDFIAINKRQSDVDFVTRTKTNSNAFVIRGDGSEIVFNEDGNDDTDFRIESNNSTKILFTDSSDNVVEIHGPAADDTDVFVVYGNGDDNVAGQNLFKINPTEVVFNQDSNDVNFRVEADGNDPAQNTTDIGTDGGVQTHLAHDPTAALYVDGSNGRVGLGTSNPDTTLHVAGSAHIEGDLWVKGNMNQIDTLVNVTSAIDITNHGTGPALSVKQTGTQPVLTVLDDNITAFHIEDGGNVGINTADPGRLLDVSFSENNSTETDDREIDGIRIINNDTTIGSKTGLNFSTPGTSMAWIGQRYNSDHMCLKLISESYKGDPNSKGSILNISASGEISYKTDVYHCSLYINDDDAIRIPVGTSAQRPDTAANNTKLGLIRYNTELQTFEGFGAGYQWGSLGGVIDVDRDTFWTATNLLSETPYPGDPDALRAYSQDTLMMQIEKDETRITTGTVGINHAPGSSIEETVHVHGGVRAQNRIYTDSGSGVYHKKYVLPSGTTEMDQFTISPVQGVQKAISFQITICNESFACVKMYNVAYVNTGYTAETKFITQKTIDTGPVSSGNDIDLDFEEHIDGINSGVVVRVKRPSGNLEARGCVTIVLAGGYTNMRINNL